MAFSGGVFSRLYDWTTDRDNGVKILASRMDEEFDGMATGLSTCILKDGTQTCTAAVPFAEGLTIPDDKTLVFGTDSDVTIQYDETTNNALEIAANVEGAALGVVLKADQGDDNADQWKVNVADGGTLSINSKISGSFVSQLTLTPNATAASSTTAIAGNITVGGTVDGRDLATDGAKLDGIEASADVTDTANVTAAGALMDSEVTNLAQVKAFNSADYATAAQGSTADSALQNVSEDTTPQLGGNLDTNGNDINFGDNDKAQFGVGNDLQIYHDTVASYVHEQGDGNLRILGTNIEVKNAGNTATYLDATNGGGVNVYYNNGVKLTTTSTGIDVTGGLDVTNSDATAIIDRIGTNVAGLYTGSGDDLTVGTDAYNQAIRIKNSSGNVGIGTTSPATPLHVSLSTGSGATPTSKSVAVIDGNDNTELSILGGSSSILALNFGHSGDADDARIAYNTTSGSENMAFTVNAAERMRIDSSGNVGIGTTSGDVTSDGNASRTYVTIQGTANRGRLNLGSTASSGADVGTLGFTNGANTVAAISVDSDAGSQTNGLMAFATSGSTRMTITSGGNVGIGTSSPSSIFHTEESTTGASIVRHKNTSNTSGAHSRLIIQNGGTSGGDAIINLDAQASGSQFTLGVDRTANKFIIANADKGSFDGSNEAMAIDSSGRLLHGATTAEGVGYTLDYNGGAPRSFFNKNYSGTATAIYFMHNGSVVGSITYSNTATAYNTSSDHRLKQDVVNMTGAIDRVKALAPKRFSWIDDADTTVDGFLAHEAQAVVPEAVTGTHNEVDEDGNPVMQGIDQSKLVPLLTGALQEAIAKIETLETQVADLTTRVAALEAN